MKKKFLKVMMILLICLLSFEAGTMLVDHIKKEEIGIKQENAAILDNEEIANSDIENEVIETNSEITKENDNDRQIDDGKSTKEIIQKNEVVSKEVTSNKHTDTKINDNQESKADNKENTKIVQVTKAETANNDKIESERTNVEKPELKVEEKQPEETLKCVGDNHFMDIGNSQKWFNTEDEAIALYNKIIKEWGEKWENFEIDDKTYKTNCPYRLPRLELYMW